MLQRPPAWLAKMFWGCDMSMIIYGDNNGRPGTLTGPDNEAVKTARSLVRDGLRNEAWATVELPDGRVYQARNAHGRVIARYTNA